MVKTRNIINMSYYYFVGTSHFHLSIAFPLELVANNYMTKKKGEMGAGVGSRGTTKEADNLAEGQNLS